MAKKVLLSTCANCGAKLYVDEIPDTEGAQDMYWEAFYLAGWGIKSTTKSNGDYQQSPLCPLCQRCGGAPDATEIALAEAMEKIERLQIALLLIKGAVYPVNNGAVDAYCLRQLQAIARRALEREE